METMEVGVGLGTEKNVFRAVQDAVYQAKKNLSAARKIDLAVIFTSIEFAQAPTLKAIATLLGQIKVIGASSAAIISNHGIFKHGLAVMLLSFPSHIQVNTACVKNVKDISPASAGKELGEKLLSGFHNIHRDLSIVFSDGLIQEGSNFIAGLQARLGTSFPLLGASASDNLRFLKTYIYFNQEVTNDAACGIIWGGKLSFGFGIKHGWEPLGKPRQVTKSYENIIYEIDHAPAAQVYQDYFNFDLNKFKKELKRISIFYPIGIYLPGEEEYLLRNILSIEDDGALIFQGNVPQDSQIRLMIGSKESCLQATRQALNAAKRNLGSQPVKFAFIFDSISRYMLLGRDAQKELEMIKADLGENTPLIGLYTYGEQAPLEAISYQGKAYFHNQTVTIVAIGG